MIKQLIAVGIGGGAGSILRFLGSQVTRKYFDGAFPLATFMVNLLGCFLIGLFIGILDGKPDTNGQLKLLLITGFCGGFTTFSAFANENLQLLQNNQFILALTYTIASVLLGILMVWVGMWCPKVI